jgi:hypothetical protein
MVFLVLCSAMPLVHVSPSAEASEPGIMALDVCNTSGSLFHAGVDFSYLCESPDMCSPEKVTVLHEIAELPLKYSLFAFQLERPPKS